MTTLSLTRILHRLYLGRDLATGTSAPVESCLHDPDVRSILREALRRQSDAAELAALVAEEGISAAERNAVPTPQQLSRVLTGSRTVVDPDLRALPAFGRYRGLLSHRQLTTALNRYESPKATAAEPWRTETFFDDGPFDKMEAEKQQELAREVRALGLQRATERLPAYMQRARRRLPRSFEPWSKEERALLIEAMCYTNDAERLAAVFGRSASAVRQEGQRLIWESRSRGAA